MASYFSRGTIMTCLVDGSFIINERPELRYRHGKLMERDVKVLLWALFHNNAILVGGMAV